MKSKDVIQQAIEDASDIQDRINILEEERDEALLTLRGVKLNKQQKEYISNFIEGYVAYELTEEGQ